GVRLRVGVLSLRLPGRDLLAVAAAGRRRGARQLPGLPGQGAGPAAGVDGLPPVRAGAGARAANPRPVADPGNAADPPVATGPAQRRPRRPGGGPVRPPAGLHGRRRVEAEGEVAGRGRAGPRAWRGPATGPGGRGASDRPACLAIFGGRVMMEENWWV